MLCEVVSLAWESRTFKSSFTYAPIIIASLKAVDQAQHETCFACHQANVKDHDFVFTRFAP